MKKCPFCAEENQVDADICRYCFKSLRADSRIVFFWGPPSAGLIGLFGRLDIVIDGIERCKVGFLKLARFNIDSGDHEVIIKMGKNTSLPLVFNLAPGEEKHFTCKLKEDFNLAYRPLFKTEESLEVIEYRR